MNLTLTQRLSIVFSVLLLACCGASAWLQIRSSDLHDKEVIQGLSRGLAGHIARGTPLMDGNGLRPADQHPLVADDAASRDGEAATAVERDLRAGAHRAQRLDDGRYFQVTPGKHELVVRFDYEIYSGGFSTDPTERTCYLTVRYNDFKAGQRYRLEARAPAMQPQVLLYDANRKVVVNEPSNVTCIP